MQEIEGKHLFLRKAGQNGHKPVSRHKGKYINYGIAGFAASEMLKPNDNFRLRKHALS